MNQRPEPTPEGELIARYQKRSGLSIREAARRAGISEGWWRQITKGYQSLSGGGYGPVKGPAETVARMAFVVSVPHHRLVEVGRDDAAAELSRMIREEREDREADAADDSADAPALEPWERKVRAIEELTREEREHIVVLVKALRAATSPAREQGEGVRRASGT